MGKMKELFTNLTDNQPDDDYPYEYSQYEYDCMLEIQDYFTSLEEEEEYFDSIEFLNSLEKLHELNMEYARYLNNENT
jgi:hypothetical protein